MVRRRPHNGVPGVKNEVKENWGEKDKGNAEKAEE